MQQIRANKRHEVLMKKRKIGIEGSPPHLIVSSCMHALNLVSVLGRGGGIYFIAIITGNFLKYDGCFTLWFLDQCTPLLQHFSKYTKWCVLYGLIQPLQLPHSVL